MTHHVFRGAADENMFEPGGAVSGRNDQVCMLRGRPRANLLTRMPDLERWHDLNPIPIAPFHQLAHLTSSDLFGLLHQ